jgi:hypothetical protein
VQFGAAASEPSGKRQDGGWPDIGAGAVDLVERTETEAKEAEGAVGLPPIAVSTAVATSADVEEEQAKEKEEERLMLEAFFRASISHASPVHLAGPAGPMRWLWYSSRQLKVILQCRWAAPAAAALAVAFAFSAILSVLPSPAGVASTTLSSKATIGVGSGSEPALTRTSIWRWASGLRAVFSSRALRMSSGVPFSRDAYGDLGLVAEEIRENAAQEADPLLYLLWRPTVQAHASLWTAHADSTAAVTFAAFAAAAAAGWPRAGRWIMAAGCVAIALIHGGAAAQLVDCGQVVLAAIATVNTAVAAAGAVTVTVVRAQHLIWQLVIAAGLVLLATAAALTATVTVTAAAGGLEHEHQSTAAARRSAIAGAALIFPAVCVELAFLLQGRRQQRAARLAAACRAVLDARFERVAAGCTAWLAAATATETLARELGLRTAAAGDKTLRQEAECAEQLVVQAEAADLLLRRKVPCAELLGLALVEGYRAS